MSILWKEDTQNVNWDELSNLYEIAPLGKKDPNELKVVFSASLYVYFVYDEDRLVGAGRALADGKDCSYICDVAVAPDYQGRGIGKDIMTKLLESSKNHKKILLYSVPGKEEFYAKFGFKHMKTAMAIFEDQQQAIQRQLIDL